MSWRPKRGDSVQVRALVRSSPDWIRAEVVDVFNYSVRVKLLGHIVLMAMKDVRRIMNIQEAIKTGKPFRRPGWDNCIVCPKGTDSGLHWEDQDHKLLTGKFIPRAEDLLANDWFIDEIKPRKLGWVSLAGEVRLRAESEHALEDYARAPWLDEPEDRCSTQK